MKPVSPEEWAVVRLATIQKKGSAGRLLLATVTLLPSDRPLPPVMSGVDRCSVEKTGENVFFRRTILSKQEAITWYRSLGSGGEKTPIPTRQTDSDRKLDGVPISVSHLTDNPSWPQLGLPIGEELFSQPTEHAHPAPFVGTTASRVHRRFGKQVGFDALLENDAASAFVARRMHIDLRLYREYLGSAALISPDQIIQQIDNFMIPSEGERGERIFYRFVPRPGKTLERLRVTTFDKETNLLTNFETHAIPADGVLDIDKGSCTGTYGFVVTHPEHGVLAYSPLTGFLRQINLSIHAVSSGGTEISVPLGDSPNAKRMKYLAANSSQLSSSSILGKAPESSNDNARVAMAASQREKMASAALHGQRWFPNGSREEAVRFVQDEIRKARSRIIIADPYLSGLQLGQFLYAANGDAVEVVLLTSPLAFKPKRKNQTRIDILNDFRERLEQLKVRQKVATNVFLLSASELHDRFLVIDDNVWFLGNSLNALGDKASMIVKIPNPDEVISHLGIMKRKAEDFDSYFKSCLKQQ